MRGAESHSLSRALSRGLHLLETFVPLLSKNPSLRTLLRTAEWGREIFSPFFHQ